MTFRQTDYLVADIRDRFKDNKIFFDPSYQRRGDLWTVRDKRFLIETVFLGYLIPSIVIRNFVERGHERIEVVDGQQRLLALTQFLENKFAIRMPRSNGPARYFRDLSPAEQDIFLSFRLPAILLENVNKDEIPELFSRLNRKSTTLNAAERRHGRTSGRLKEVINTVTDGHLSELINGKVLTEQEHKRMKDRDLVTEILTSILLKKVAIYPYEKDYLVFKGLPEGLPETVSDPIPLSVVIDRTQEVLGFVFDLIKELGAGEIRNHNFVSVAIAAYCNKWGDIEIGHPYQSSGYFVSDLHSAVTTLKDLFKAKSCRDLDGPCSDFVNASLKTTDSKKHRETRASWLLHILQTGAIPPQSKKAA